MSTQDRNGATVPRPRGRPRVERRLEQVGTSLPPEYYERLKLVAAQRDISVSSLVRQLLILRLR